MEVRSHVMWKWWLAILCYKIYWSHDFHSKCGVAKTLETTTPHFEKLRDHYSSKYEVARDPTILMPFINAGLEIWTIGCYVNVYWMLMMFWVIFVTSVYDLTDKPTPTIYYHLWCKKLSCKSLACVVVRVHSYYSKLHCSFHNLWV